MIQAIAQSIPLYAMSCFKIQKGLIHELNMIIAGFWWGDKGIKKGIHRKQWEELCCSKLDGGLGFKELENFNLVMLAKQWLCLIQNGNSLSHKVLRATYFSRSNPNKVSKGPNASYIWSLLEGRKVIEKGSI